MAKFQLLSGVHVDYDTSSKGSDGNPVQKEYRVGQTVESDVDLVAKFGPERFKLISGTPKTKSKGTGNQTPGDPPADIVDAGVAKFPHGQVSTGNPQAMSAMEGTPTTPPFETHATPESEGEEESSSKSKSSKSSSSGESEDEEDDLDSQHVPDLKKLAEEEEVDISGLRTKSDIVDAIRSSRKGK